MGVVKFDIGNIVSYKNLLFRILVIQDYQHLVIEKLEDGEIITVDINEIKEVNSKECRDIEVVNNEKLLDIASKRFKIIEPYFIENKSINQIVISSGKSRSTINRWIHKYKQSKNISALAPMPHTGGKGKNRIQKEVLEIMDMIIRKYYLTLQGESISLIIVRIKIECNRHKLKPPCDSTVRSYIARIPAFDKMKKREGIKKAKEKYSPVTGSLEALYPLHIVQMDHSKLDILLVDEDGMELGRPWLTIALDIYSRMVTGYYLTFDSPGAESAGMCIATSILTKEYILQEYDIHEEWPIYGVMDTLHMDNAKEFTGTSIKNSAKLYGINLMNRRIGYPEDGGHIERFFRTINNEIKNLPGATDSNTLLTSQHRRNSKAFTINDLEKWILTFILCVYHEREHSGINMSPMHKYKLGIEGDRINVGRGLPKKVSNQKEVFLNFLPSIERTPQRYGIQIKYLRYYSKEIASFINKEDKNNRKIKLIFKMWRNKTSPIFFLNPNDNQYYEVPYSNLTFPIMDRREYNLAYRKAKETYGKKLDESKILEGYKKMIQIKDIVVKRSKSKKRQKQSTIQEKTFNDSVTLEKEIQMELKEFEFKEKINLEPFEDIDYDAL